MSLSSRKRMYTKFVPDVDTRAFNSGMRVQREWHRFNVNTIMGNVGFEGKRALDAGCGSGAFDFEIASKFDTRITGVDFNEEAVGFARRRAKEMKNDNLEFVTAACEDMPFRDSSFDIVFSCELLEHLAEPAAALREMRRVLRAGGEAVFITQNWRSPWPVVEWLWDCFGDGRDYGEVHLSKFTPDSLKKMVEDSGFVVEKIYTTHNVFPFFHLVGGWYPRRIEKYLAGKCLGLTLVVKGRAV